MFDSEVATEIFNKFYECKNEHVEVIYEPRGGQVYFFL
jgi:hypothetical protein